MEWKETPPRKPGLYWAKFNDGRVSVVELTDDRHVQLLGGVLYAPVGELSRFGVHLQWGDRLEEPT